MADNLIKHNSILLIFISNILFFFIIEKLKK